MWAFRTSGRYSLVTRVEVSKTAFELVKNSQIPWSFGDRSSNRRALWNLGFGVQYKGKPFNRDESPVEARILRNRPLKFL